MGGQKTRKVGQKGGKREQGWVGRKMALAGCGVRRGPRKELNRKGTGRVTLLSDYSNLLYLLIMYFISAAWGGYDSAQIRCKFMEMEMQRGCRPEPRGGLAAWPSAHWRLVLSGLGEPKIETSDLGATGLSCRPKQALTLSLCKAYLKKKKKKSDDCLK